MLPFTTSGETFIEAFQTSVGLVSYLCDIDSTFHLSDKLFEYKGPVVISDVFWKNYRNLPTKDENGEYKWHTPTSNPAYDTTSITSKQDALDKFKELQLILNIK